MVLPSAMELLTPLATVTPEPMMVRLELPAKLLADEYPTMVLF